MSHTKKLHKNITKRAQEICVLGETHHYLDGNELLRLLENRVFVNIKHTCFQCENKIKQKYAVAVNTRQIKYPYQLYRDTIIEMGFNNLILYSIITDKQQSQKLEQLQKDLQVCNSEKLYDVRPETEEQNLTFLYQQNYFVKDYRKENQKVKYTIHLPIGRDFTLPSETAAINSLSKIVEMHPREMYVTVYEDQ